MLGNLQLVSGICPPPPHPCQSPVSTTRRRCRSASRFASGHLEEMSDDTYTGPDHGGGWDGKRASLTPTVHVQPGQWPAVFCCIGMVGGTICCMGMGM